MQASFRTHPLRHAGRCSPLTWLAAGCGGAGDTASASQPASTTAGASVSAPEWADRANGICEAALPDQSHELVDHLDPEARQASTG